MRALRNTACIVGVDESDELGTLPHKSQLTLHVEAVRNAVRDAGLLIGDVDGLFTAGQHSPATVGEALGIMPRYVDGTTVGGCSFIIMVDHALLALHHGLCDVAVISHGESGRSGVGVTPRRDTALAGQYEMPFGFGGAPTYFGMITTRHMHEHGTTLEQWAQVAVSTRQWAALNPGPGTASRSPSPTSWPRGRSCYPFNLLNICLVTDAGGAVVLTRADRARDCARPPVYVRGAGEATEHVMLTQMRNLTFSEATRISGDRAFAMAGVGPGDFDHVMLYDAFTSGPPIMLESLGFCQPGEGVQLLRGGPVHAGRPLPINTNGGGLSYTHSACTASSPSSKRPASSGRVRRRARCRALALPGQRHGRHAVGGRDPGAVERALRWAACLRCLGDVRASSTSSPGRARAPSPFRSAAAATTSTTTGRGAAGRSRATPSPGACTRRSSSAPWQCGRDARSRGHRASPPRHARRLRVLRGLARRAHRAADAGGVEGLAPARVPRPPEVPRAVRARVRGPGARRRVAGPPRPRRPLPAELPSPPAVDRHQADPARPVDLIEDIASFAFEGTTVFAAPDFAYWNRADRLQLIDWKTGGGGGHASLQLPATPCSRASCSGSTCRASTSWR